MQQPPHRYPQYARANSNILRDSQDETSADEGQQQHSNATVRAVNMQQQQNTPPADDSDGGEDAVAVLVGLGDDVVARRERQRHDGLDIMPRGENGGAGGNLLLVDDEGDGDEPMLQPAIFYDDDDDDDVGVGDRTGGENDVRPSSTSMRYNRRNDFRDTDFEDDDSNDTILAANYAIPSKIAGSGDSGGDGGNDDDDVGDLVNVPSGSGGNGVAHHRNAIASGSNALASMARPPLAGLLPATVVGAQGQNPLHNWQATKHTLKERFSFMFCNEILADVHFIVGRGEQRIPAHKFVLSVGSAVFDTMFNGAMASHTPDDIELPDVEPAAFLALLKFLYSDDFQIGPESVMTTLYTAKKYAVPALEYACVDFLKRNLNSDNAFMLLTQARLFDETPLAKMCMEMIDKHTAEALNAEGFTDVDLDTLSCVIERDTLRIREVALFQAVVRWSVAECHRRQLPVTSENQRQVLGRALHCIRFPLMTVEEFAQTAAQGGILTDREVVNLFLFFTVNPKPSVGFLDVPRCCVTGKEQVVNRFQKIEGRWGYSGTPDRIKFNVDRRIFVVGFGLYGSIHGPSEYQVTIQIIHCGSGKVMASNDTSFQCDGSLNTFRVLFKEPVEIMPGVTYIASACLKGVDSHYGAKGVRRIVHQSSGGCSITFQFTYAAGNNNGTSVEDGQIPEIIFYTKLNS